MSDLISRQAAIEALQEKVFHDLSDEFYGAMQVLDELPSAEPKIVRCNDCNNASKCYGDVVMRSRGGGNIYCPLEFCSAAERRTDERPYQPTGGD